MAEKTAEERARSVCVILKAVRGGLPRKHTENCGECKRVAEQIRAAVEAERKKLAPHAETICTLLEIADNRALARDGSANTPAAFNELSDSEKRRFYKAAAAIRRKPEINDRRGADSPHMEET